MPNKAGLIFLLFLLSAKPALAQVVINEIYPNPPGNADDEKQNEWVELYNNGSESIDVLGFKMIDDKDHKLIINLDHTSSTIINPNSFLLVSRNGHPTFSLNNSSETIKLLDTQDTLLDQHSYQNAEENLSFGRIPDGGRVFSRETKTFTGRAKYSTSHTNPYAYTNLNSHTNPYSNFHSHSYSNPHTNPGN